VNAWSVTVVAQPVALENHAVTLLAALIVPWQELLPEHAPDQPANAELPSGVAVSVTTVPPEYDSEQSPPHEMPAGELFTVPVPPPLFETESA
jgi:hypothetical protein